MSRTMELLDQMKYYCIDLKIRDERTVASFIRKIKRAAKKEIKNVN